MIVNRRVVGSVDSVLKKMASNFGHCLIYHVIQSVCEGG
jgi:hypothetical protein